MTDATLHQGDCLAFMQTLPSDSVDAVVVDLPYFRVVKDSWDNQWKNRAEFVDWVCSLALEWKRILRHNGSLFLFADEMNEAYIQVRLDELFILLNKIVWFKYNAYPQKGVFNLRSFAPMTERALFYCTQSSRTGLETVMLDINNFSSLREYFKKLQTIIGLSTKEINARLGHRKAEHAFYWNSTQWSLPTEEVYGQILSLVPDWHVGTEYEKLRLEYEKLRRPFNPSRNTLDVIQHPIISSKEKKEAGGHSTVKPVALMEKIISAITNEGQTVLDCCMGSGSTGVACIRLGRNFIGCELSPEHFEVAKRRIEQEQQKKRLF